MDSLRSFAAGGHARAKDVATEAYNALAKLYPTKFYWFVSNGYRPHEWQAAFHTADLNGRLKRFRHLVAGRRGGKTMSAAWEVLFYCLHPEEFHQDAHSVSSSRPLWVWVLAKDHEVGRPARMAFQEALNQAGLSSGRDYKWNKTEKTVEFENGTFLQFKTADDPQSLRGAGLDILWIDEAAFITSEDAWTVVRPALSDKIGLLVTTTTPQGKNWFYEEFFTGKALEDPRQFRVEYTSIDNPYFHKEEWEYAKEHMHPAMFKQEHLAAFDAMAGLTLNGDWLKYWTFKSTQDSTRDEIPLPRGKDGVIRLRKYLGVDPSTGVGKDAFAIACIGITEDLTQGFLIDYYLDRNLQFPDQVDMIRTWQLKHRPELIGIEAQAYQRSLVQQASRLQGFPGIVPVIQPGRSGFGKNERIIAMSPVFKIGKVRIHANHMDFIDQWVSFDGQNKENRDDLLDATEIALSVAGVLLPMLEVAEDKKVRSIEEEAYSQIMGLKDKARYIDRDLGSEA